MSYKNLKALILAGGMGTRLQPYTFFVPKPMLPLADKPLLEHLILWLRRNGINEIVISVSYLRKTIEGYFGNGSEWNINISYARASSPLGIGGQILVAKAQINSTFCLLYGDSVFDFKLKKMLDGLIERDEKTQKVTDWKEKPEVGGLINVGCYFAEPRLFDYIPAGKMYGFENVVKNMIKSGERIYAYTIEGEFMDIGDEKSYKRVYDLYMRKLGRIL